MQPPMDDELALAGFIAHHIAYERELPPLTAAKYEYVLAAAGIMIRARRENLEVCLTVAEPMWPVMGLAEIEPYLRLHSPPVPAHLVAEMFARARAVCRPAPEAAEQPVLLENLCYLNWNMDAQVWELTEPLQERRYKSVRPLEDGPDSAYARALIEVHSHHHWEAIASETDDLEESGKFRLFAVLGNIFTEPEIRVRVCVHEYFIEVPAALVFELPAGVRDPLAEELCQQAHAAGLLAAEEL